MKFRREHKADFHFIDPESFSMIAANGFQLTGTSINDILHTTIPQAQVNAAVTRNATKCQINEISDPSDHESKHCASVEVLGLEQPFKKRLRLSSPTPPLLTCSANKRTNKQIRRVLELNNSFSLIREIAS